MDSYRIEWKQSAIRELRKLPKGIIPTIATDIGELQLTHFRTGLRNSAAEHTYRIRQGSYRVVYTVTKSLSLIEIVRIGHRREVYDR